MELGDPATKTVLIVDDDEGVLNLLDILVRRDGFKVDLATTGDRALSRLERKPDAMLLDLMLPGTTTGFEVLKRLREAQRAVPPIIIVTAFAADAEVKKLELDPNVIAILSKPINQERLLASLHKALKTKAPERKKEPPKPQQ
ncbi:MAG: response regulator transcription factor [Elusimicrobia bacterium]|nr:response regulator transcription factor [Elusimicrobiota bacterium]